MNNTQAVVAEIERFFIRVRSGEFAAWELPLVAAEYEVWALSSLANRNDENMRQDLLISRNDGNVDYVQTLRPEPYLGWPGFFASKKGDHQ